MEVSLRTLLRMRHTNTTHKQRGYSHSSRIVVRSLTAHIDSAERARSMVLQPPSNARSVETVATRETTPPPHGIETDRAYVIDRHGCGHTPSSNNTQVVRLMYPFDVAEISSTRPSHGEYIPCEELGLIAVSMEHVRCMPQLITLFTLYGRRLSSITRHGPSYREQLPSKIARLSCS
jgi:hypothetical protein